MKILQVHNHYQQQGGEHAVFEAEARLLQAHGHEVIRFTKHNEEVTRLPQLQLAQRTLWNQEVYRELRSFVRVNRPDVMHAHNTLPLISPAAYYAARREGVPVVQTLHNYRLVCPSGLLFRQGQVCELCVGKAVPWPGVLHACYRRSRAASAGVAAMLAAHRLANTWQQQVNVYVALTEFARTKFVAGGLPAHRIVVKPNFVEVDPGEGQHRGGFALFVGRLSQEKGVDTLIDAWQGLTQKLPLKVVGAGPLEPQLRGKTDSAPEIQFLGAQPPERVRELMRDAWLLVVPSRCYEGALPLVVLEAFAAGLPVVASDLGGFSTGIHHARTGLLFHPGDPEDLRRTIEWVRNRPHEAQAIGQRGRQVFEAHYTAEANYRMLLQVYAVARSASLPNGAGVQDNSTVPA